MSQPLLSATEQAALLSRMADYEAANNTLRDELMKALIDASDNAATFADAHAFLKDLTSFLVERNVTLSPELAERLAKVRMAAAKQLGADEPAPSVETASSTPPSHVYD